MSVLISFSLLIVFVGSDIFQLDPHASKCIVARLSLQLRYVHLGLM